MFIEIFVVINVFVLLGGLVALLFVEEFNSHKRKLIKDKIFSDLLHDVRHLSIDVTTMSACLERLISRISRSKTLSFTDDMFTELEEKYLNDKGVL